MNIVPRTKLYSVNLSSHITLYRDQYYSFTISHILHALILENLMYLVNYMLFSITIKL